MVITKHERKAARLVHKGQCSLQSLRNRRSKIGGYRKRSTEVTFLEKHRMEIGEDK
jgi:hypothetical protein